MSNAKSDTNVSEFLESVIKDVEAKYTLKQNYVGISTGVNILDKMSGGLAPETLWVIAGRPSSAKTSLAMKMINTALTVEKKKVAVFTSDHTPKDFILRLIASHADLDISSLHTGRVPDVDWTKIVSSAGAITIEQLDLFPNTWISIKEVKRIVTSGKYDLIVIDKFHSLILKDEAQEGSNNRINELNQSAIELKGIAKDFQATVVLICDTNKGLSERVDQRPMLKDLKDLGGVLESYADVVIGMFIPDEAREESWKTAVQIQAIALKNRYNPQATMHLGFNRSSQNITEWEEDLPKPMPAPPPPFRHK